MIENITIPFLPRKLQRKIIRKLKRFNVLNTHRRFGKSTLAINLLIKECLDNPGSFCAYVAPTLRQANIIAWHSPQTSFLTYLQPLISKEFCKPFKNDSRINFKNGSVIQLFGADEPDRMRGIGLNAVVLDEVTRIKHYAWSEIILPALSDNQGWALFISTPKGMNNLFYDLYVRNKDNPEWYVEDLPASKTGILPQEELDRQKKEMGEEKYAQEFECSFEASLQGSYYGTLINDAQKEERIGNFPWRSDKLVYAVMDLGLDDSTAIWFYQKDHYGIYLIDYYEDCNEPIQYYLKMLQEKTYSYGYLFLPHDANKRSYERADKKSRIQIAKDFGFRVKMVPKIGINEGINRVRTLLPRCYFDKQKCAYGIDALKEYRKEINDKMSVKGRLTVFKDHPLHDWTCITGDTKIRTLNGWFQIKDLVDKDFYVWSYNFEQKRLYPAKANKCWKAKTVNQIIKITLDDESIIKCTPDHLFLKRNEKYIEAQNLQIMDSLMPFYERSYNDYISVHLNDGTIAKEHEFIYSIFNGYLEDGYHIHHKDKNKINNNPENLQKLSIQEHISLHSSEPERIKKLLKNSKNIDRSKQKYTLIKMNKYRSGENHHTKNSEYYTSELRNKVGIGVVKAYKDSEKIKQCIGCNELIKANWKRLYCCDNCKATKRRRDNGIENKYPWQQKHSENCKIINKNNHKVIKVEKLEGIFDVYDISVPNFNNFVAEGVVIHNSHSADSFRYLCVGYKERNDKREYQKQRKAKTDYNPFRL